MRSIISLRSNITRRKANITEAPSLRRVPQRCPFRFGYRYCMYCDRRVPGGERAERVRGTMQRGEWLPSQRCAREQPRLRGSWRVAVAAVDDDEQIVFAQSESGTATGRGSILVSLHKSLVSATKGNPCKSRVSFFFMFFAKPHFLTLFRQSLLPQGFVGFFVAKIS